MNFYKITNADETHYGMKYKTGLNVDVESFNPSGNCYGGGIYFASEDILAFLHYGPYIREVTLPEDARVYENPGYPKKWKADRIILGERREITAEVIKSLIEEGADPKVGDSFALRWAASNGHIEIVRVLLPCSNVKARDFEAFRCATMCGHIEVVKLLLPYSNVEFGDFDVWRWAVENGYTEVARLIKNYWRLRHELK